MPSIDDWETDLMRDALEKSGILRFKALGSSMFPTILSGDVVTVENTSLSDIQVGEILLYESNQSFFVHRLVKKDGCCFITKGDYMEFPDIPIKSSQILGKVTKIERWGKTFRPDSPILKPINYLLSKFVTYRSFIVSIEN